MMCMRACVFLEKSAMVVETMLVQEGENGFMIEVEQRLFPLGERLGFRYNACILYNACTLV